MLSYRKRGKVWHARGTYRVAGQTYALGEYSTGCSTRADAEAETEAHVARIRQELLDGPAGRAKRTSIAECFLDYGARAKGVAPQDAAIVEQLNEALGHRPVTEAVDAWADWLRRYGAGWSAATQARRRSIFVAALRMGCELRQITPPKVPAISQPDAVRARYLGFDEQERLLGAYTRWAANPVLVMCYQGARTQEALQMQWRDVSFAAGTLFIQPSKNGTARMLAMHPRVRTMLERLDATWRERHAGLAPPPGSAVFLSHRGEPYRDTRGEGGNPLAQAHASACAAAGVDDFRPHDWRHHWASWQVMNGTDLITLQRLGGWKDHRSVLRYAAVSTEHMAAAISRMR